MDPRLSPALKAAERLGRVCKLLNSCMSLECFTGSLHILPGSGSLMKLDSAWFEAYLMSSDIIFTGSKKCVCVRSCFIHESLLHL
jgi:hypothetical protein